MSFSAVSPQHGLAGRVVVLCVLSSVCAAAVLGQHYPLPLRNLVSHRNEVDVPAPPPAANPAPVATPFREPAYRLMSVTVERDFASAMKLAGVGADASSMLTNAFSRQIDFRREVRRGNEVKFIFGNRANDAALPLAVRIEAGPRVHDVFLFRNEGGASYYPKQGPTLASAMSRFPVAFRRISSLFSLRRLDPVTGQWAPHDGVDLAAPVGTPVRATADGTVVFAGEENGYGNVVKLRNPAPYSTTFAHLSRFAAGIRAGGSVRRGDLVGYVGATGWATGPHLHYEVRVNGVPQDPLKVDLPLGNPVGTADAANFQKESEQLAALF